VNEAPAHEESALERAEVLVKRIEEDAGRIARTALTRVVEVAEDIWAEAQSARRKNPAER
jgi:hypothetical protein